MSIVEIIAKQLKSYPKLKKAARIAYFSSKPLEQVHMDTGFWQNSGSLNEKKTPFLVICDVATRFTMFFVQEKKSQGVKEYLKLFIQAVKAKWPENYSNDMLLITDGARELVVRAEIDKVYVHSQISKGINKAVLAEVSIRKARAILRDYEAKINIHNLNQGTNWRIDHTNLKEILEMVQNTINEKARIREPKPAVPFAPSEFVLGQPVFALNLFKYHPHALKAQMVKQGYMQNWYYEPFYISKVILVNGIYKYNLKAYTDNQELKYSFYADQLQKIDPSYASQYIKDYMKNGAKIADFEEEY